MSLPAVDLRELSVLDGDNGGVSDGLAVPMAILRQQRRLTHTAVASSPPTASTPSAG